MSTISRTELCQWLRANSSGIYHHAADAADVIEMLAQLSDQHFARAMANGGEVIRLREENERLRKDADRYRWLCIDKEQADAEVDAEMAASVTEAARSEK